VNSSLGWAVGSNGVVLGTQDGGTSWRSLTSFVTSGYNLDDVHFANANQGWAVGDRGRIVRSTDGGQTWAPLYWSGLDGGGDENYTPPNLHGIRFLDSQRGYAVGSNTTILRTLDGGDNWDVLFSPVAGSFNKTGWLNASRGWIVGGAGIILGTVDGGDNWELLFSGTDENLNHVAVAPAGPTGLTVWVVGARGTVLKSTNGLEFEPVDVGFPFATLESVAFLPNGQHGWIVGNNGLVLRTKDGGATWTTMDAGVGDSQLLRAIFPVSADEVWLAGYGGTLRVFR
jgi:photosystem II stability/assembly factor-like uncharacterized protein